jgi:activating signal cointegrator complex subunit 2
MAVPLDEQFKIEKKGIIEKRIPVLHPSGMEQHYFVTYIPLPTNIEDGGAVEQWIERMNFISDDLTWLLQQNHTKFWCEVAFNKDFHSMLDSYLRYAPRPQRTISSNTYSFIPNGKQLEENISRLMFMCILRLSTHKESAENFFTPQGFGQIIYENYIFDIPRLFDICSLYAIHNKELLSKMIGNIFKQQQGYNKDLQHAIQSIQDVITDRIKAFYTPTGPKKLTTTNTKSSGMEELIDLLYYILDLSCTINRLFSVYPEGRLMFFHEHFHLTLINLFETFLRAYERARQSHEIPDKIEIFEEAKYETISLFNDLLASCCIDPLLINENKSENVESLINIFSLLITEKRFLAAYEDYFNLSEIIEIVHQTTGLLDDQQIQFYTDGVKQAIELHGTPSCKRKLISVSDLMEYFLFNTLFLVNKSSCFWNFISKKINKSRCSNDSRSISIFK